MCVSIGSEECSGNCAHDLYLNSCWLCVRVPAPQALPSAPTAPRASTQRLQLQHRQTLAWTAPRAATLELKVCCPVLAHFPSMINIRISIYIYMYMYTYIHACTRAHTHTCIHMYVYVYVYTHTHTHIHIYIYILTYMYARARAYVIRETQSLMCVSIGFEECSDKCAHVLYLKPAGGR